MYLPIYLCICSSRSIHLSMYLSPIIELLQGLCSCDYGGSVQFSSVAQSCLTFWDPMNRIMEAGKSQICRPNIPVWVWSLGAAVEPGRVWKQWGRRICFLRERLAFILFWLPTDWTRPTHPGEGNQLYSICWFKCWSHPETQIHPEYCLSRQMGIPWSSHTDIEN